MIGHSPKRLDRNPLRGPRPGAVGAGFLRSPDFDAIPNAVLAASDGDTILIKPGGYGAVSLTKGVALVGDVGPTGVRPSLREASVQVPAASARVLLRGLEIVAPTRSARPRPRSASTRAAPPPRVVPPSDSN